MNFYWSIKAIRANGNLNTVNNSKITLDVNGNLITVSVGAKLQELNMSNIEMIPGVILQNAAMAALRSRGLTAQDFATHSKVSVSQVRFCLFGASQNGPATKLREKMVDFADRGLVERIYVDRMREEVEKLRAWAA